MDVIPFKDIDDIISSAGPESDRLTIKFGQNDSVSLAVRPDTRSGTGDQSTSRSTLRELEMDIRGARSRLRDTPTTQKSLRPSDVPGALLNFALLNMHSPDDTLRSASYDLLSELTAFFKFNLDAKVPRAACTSNSLDLRIRMVQFADKS